MAYRLCGLTIFVLRPAHEACAQDVIPLAPSSNVNAEGLQGAWEMLDLHEHLDNFKSSC